MISVSRLLCDGVGPGDHLRYGVEGETSPTAFPRPVVVWNCTRLCNLNCVHCYADAAAQSAEGEMTGEEGKAFIRQLAEFGVPVILFSGGEPLMRPDFLELAGFAAAQGIGIVASTNGTLIDHEMATRMRHMGFREVGISLDGIGDTNDRLRGKRGAFEAALHGIRNCVSVGQRVSLRLTITRSNHHQIPEIFALAEEQGIDRICFYHLAYVGRAKSLKERDLSHQEKRKTVDLICDRTVDLYRRKVPKEVLLVGNHADGVHLYLRTRERDPVHAERVLSLLRRNGGNNSGIRIGAVDEVGDVHPGQFWRTVTLGNVRERAFGDIWLDTANPVLRGLRDRKAVLKGRCARCRYLDVCNGNSRERAEATFGDIWQEDPACYITDREIGAVP
ncbi:MAG: radical SAM protein [Chloroflexota bacterium]|nr:radical SAM protein [Chloroflexota bacterium]